MRPLLDLVEHEQPWTIPLEHAHAVAANRVLRVNSRRFGPTRTVVELVGEVDMLTAPLLAERLDEHLSEGVGQIVLDLSGLTFLSAGGLNVVVAADNCARDRGVEILLAGCDGIVGRVFEAAGVRNRFDFIDARHCLVGQD